MPKKPGAIECELHRTIGLMSHVNNTILHVLIDRLGTSIRASDITHSVWICKRQRNKERHIHAACANRKAN